VSAAGLLLLAAGLLAVGMRVFESKNGKDKDSPPPPPPPIEAAADLSWLPKKLRQDFPRKDFLLEAELLTGQPGEGGLRLLKVRDKMRIRITVGRKAYVGVWARDADGTVYQLFPNEHEKDHLFEANKPRVVPNPEVATFFATLTEGPQGIDRLWVEASTEPWESVEGKRVGAFLQFQTERSRGLWYRQRSVLRGVEVEGTAPGKEGLRLKVDLAEQALAYQVRPNP
jgi:hypothetical protein